MEHQSPEKAATSPAPESVIDLESEEISGSTQDSTWPRPLKELEKEKAKTSAKTLTKPDPLPTAKALNQEQQKKKKLQQQQPLEKQ